MLYCCTYSQQLLIQPLVIQPNHLIRPFPLDTLHCVCLVKLSSADYNYDIQLMMISPTKPAKKWNVLENELYFTLQEQH